MTAFNTHHSPALENWLANATCGLAAASKDRVRAEIRDHYESAFEAAMSNGANADDADRAAVAALGDAKTASRQYRRVLLTSLEASMLREGNWEARAVHTRSWLKWLLSLIPVVMLFAAAVLYLIGVTTGARIALAGAIGLGIAFTVPLLPIYTPMRGRIYRAVKYVVLIGAIALVLGPDMLKLSWLFNAGLWPLAWIELTRMSIRRKLPVKEWPKQLHL